MIYEEYERKMRKRAAVMDALRKHRLIIFICAGVLFAAVFALLFVNGIITKDISGVPERITYGEELTFEGGDAVFGSTYCEYSVAGADEWSEAQPFMPGNYVVRLVSRRTFGIKNYGAEHAFTIDKRAATLSFAKGEVIYGEDPTLTADLVRGDRITGANFDRGELIAVTAARAVARQEFTASGGNVTVVNADGADVSAAYEFTTVTAELDVLPRPVTVTAGSAEKEYDGEPLKCESYELTGDYGMAEGDALVIAAYNSSATEVRDSGSNVIDAGDVSVSGALGDMSGFYDITLRSGTLTVTPRKIGFELGSAEKVYDGTPLTCAEYEQTGECVSGQTPEFYGWSQLTRAGEAENTAFVSILDGSRDVTDNYDITVTAGTLTVEKRGIEIASADESFSYCGYYIGGSEYSVIGELAASDSVSVTFDAGAIVAGEYENAFDVRFYGDAGDVTDCYDVVTTFGTLTVTPVSVTIETANESFVYDGTAHTGSVYTFTDGKLVGSDELSVDFTGSVAFVRDSGSENSAEFSIYNPIAGEYVQDSCYDITVNFGTLAVTARPITITMDSGEWMYDGTAHSLSSGRADDLADGDVLTVYSLSEITDVGEVVYNELYSFTVMRGDEDVTENYLLTAAYPGRLAVTQRPVSITASDGEKVYDGSPVSPDEPFYTVGGYGIADGQREDVRTIYTPIIRAGSVQHYIDSVTVYDDSGRDVTRNYLITAVSGTLTVTPRSLTLTSDDLSKMYDGSPLTGADYNAIGVTAAHGYAGGVGIGGDGIAQTDELSIEWSGSLLFAGTTDGGNTYGATLTHETLGDVTDCYYITYYYGSLTVTRRPLTLTSDDLSKMYDGTPLTGADGGEAGVTAKYGYTDGIDIGGYGLATGEGGDYMTVTFIGSVTHVDESGNSLNTFDVSVTHSGLYANSLCTSSYDITYIFGSLGITERPLTVTTVGEEKTYDGLPASPEIVTDGLAGTDALKASYEDIIRAGTYFDVIPTELTALNSLDGSDPVKRGDYDITLIGGDIVINRRSVTLTSDSLEKEYDGSPLTGADYNSPGVTAEHGYSGGTDVGGEMLASTDSVTIDYDGEITIFGRTSNTFSYTFVHETLGDVNDCYDVITDNGTLTVTPRRVTLAAADMEFVYDGRRLDSHAAEYEGIYAATFGSLVEGHTAVFVSYAADGSITEPGESTTHVAPSSDSVKIFDGSADVTANYDITTDNGTLTIVRRPLKYETASASKVYDGTPLIAPEVIYADGALLDGHNIVIKSYTSVGPAVGSDDNVVGFIITDEYGNDITEKYYEVELGGYGVLEITPRMLYLESGSAEKVYDGTPLTAFVVYGDEALADGDTLRITDGSQIVDPGTVPNELVVEISDAEGNDGLGNYIIVWTYGTLTVLDGSGDGGAGNLDDSGSIGGGGTDGEPSDAVSMRIRSDIDGNLYLRYKSFGDYAYSGWNAAYAYTAKSLSPLYYASESLISGGASRHTLEVINFTTDYVVPYYTATYAVGANDVFLTTNNVSGYAIDYVTGDYPSDGFVKGALYSSAYAGEVAQYESFVYDTYTTLPEDTRAALAAIIAEQGWNASQGTDALISAVADYVRNAATYDLEYDAALDAESDIVVAFLTNDAYGAGVCRHFASAATALYRALGIPARYTIGYAAQTVAGEWKDVTPMTAHAWTEVYVDGTGWIVVDATAYAVFPPEPSEPPETEEKTVVYITTGSAEKEYDGEPLTCYEYEVLNPSVIESGHVCEVDAQSSVTSALTNAGTIYNSLKLSFRNAATGEDVSDNYDVVVEDYGTLTVTPRPVAFEVTDATKPYDGKPLTSDKLTVAEGSKPLVSGHSARGVMTAESTITEPGTADNVPVAVVIKDGSGKDVTDNYEFVLPEPGTLTVTDTPVITVRSYTFSYDGTDHVIAADGGSVWVYGGNADTRYEIENVGLRFTRSDGTSVSVMREAGEYTLEFYSFELYVTENGGRTLVATCENGVVGYENGFENIGLEVMSGKVTVTNRVIYLRAASLERKWKGDGDVLDASELETLDGGSWSVWIGSLAAGDVIDESSVTVTGSLSAPGTAPSYMDASDIRITDASGRDVTDCYEVYTANGTLTLT